MTDSEENNKNSDLGGEVKTPPQGMEAGMDKFARTFEASARRWELVVYPSLLAFIVLAAYGFFLIYTLTTDVGRLARSIETMVVSMDDIVEDIHAVSGNVAQMSSSVGVMSASMLQVSRDVNEEAATMKEMLVKMDNMNKAMGVMTVPIYHMRNDMSRMNHNMHQVAGPMKMMGGMFPG